MKAIKRYSWAFAAVASLSAQFSALAEDIPNTVARPKIALALGGGGTRGAAHVGVLRVLAREHIPIDFIAGTSMGAIVGGLYAAGVPLERIEKDLLDRKMLKAYVTVPIAVRVAVIPIFFVPHMFGYRPYDGLYRGEKFRNFLDKQVPESHRNMENLQIPFCAVAANLLNGRAVSIDKGNLGKALQASSAIPFLRRPVPYGDQELFVDGGIENNLPVKQARDMGGDIVIAVRVDEDVHVQEQSEKFRHILTIPHRVVSMLLSRLDDLEAKNADIVISPNVDHIHLLSEKRADAVRAIRSGELAAEAALPSIRAKLGETALAKNSQLKSDSSKTD